VGKALFIHRGGLGDFVLCFPLLQALKNGGFDHRTLVTHPSHGDLARHFSLCETALSCDGGPGYQILDYEAIIAPVSDPDRSFEVSLKRNIRASVHVFFPRPQGEGLHAQDYLFEQTRELNLSRPDLPDHWQGGKRVLIHPGSGGRGKNFPAECFLKLHHSPGPEFLLGPAEIEQGLPWPGNPVRPETLVGLAEVLKKAGLLISHDSGVAHLAAWMGVPTLVLFKTSNPAVWAPRGKRVKVLEMKKWDEKRVLAGLEKLPETRYA